MPQVDTQNLGKALDMVSDKVKVTKGKIEAGKLKKSQKELHQDKVEGIAKKFTSPDKFKPLIISQDNHIVDGHHRWGAAIHKWGEDVKIPIFRIHLPILKAIKLYKDIANSINEAMSIAARRKLARKGKSKLKRALKKRLIKMKRKRSNVDLQKASIRKAKTILMQKMMKKAPADMTMVDKMKFSQKIEKSPGKIQKIAKKILPKLKQAETERVRKMRSNNVQKANEDITIPINVGDTVLGGKFKNKRIVVKSIEKNEKGDITINGKPLLKFRLVNEQIGYGIECKNCNHSWDIEPNDDRPYLCHNCGYDSQMQKIDLVGLRDWKKTLKENVAPNHNGKSAPYGSGYDEMDEANAVSGGKVHKLITGKNLTFKGKKYSDIEFEVLGIDNNSQIVKLKILAPKNLFGEELNVPFKTIRRGPFLKTDTSKQFEGTINEIGDGSAKPFKWKPRDNVSQLMKRIYGTSEYRYHNKTHPLEPGAFRYQFRSDDGTEYVAGFKGFIEKLTPGFNNRSQFGDYRSEWYVFYNLRDDHYSAVELNTNRGEVFRVMSTMVEIVNDFLVQSEKSGYPVKQLEISAKADSGKVPTLDSKRGRLYMAFISKQFSKLKTKNKYVIDKRGDYRILLKLDGVSEGINTQLEGTINEIPMADLQKIDTFADKKLNPVDVVLTGKHFFDRLNDPRNQKDITSAELIGFFKRLSKKKKEFLDFLDQYKQIVTTDDRTNINIPFMKQANKAIAKTVMRKKDFKTSNKKLEI